MAGSSFTALFAVWLMEMFVSLQTS